MITALLLLWLSKINPRHLCARQTSNKSSQLENRSTVTSATPGRPGRGADAVFGKSHVQMQDGGACAGLYNPAGAARGSWGQLGAAERLQRLTESKKWSRRDEMMELEENERCW